MTHYCCGCGACSAICPTGAIALKENNDGFLTPAMTEAEKCIKCGKCEKVCPMLNGGGEALLNPGQKLYSFKSADPSVLKRSSSGGFAHELSRLYFKKGFDVAGCVYNMQAELAEHKIIYHSGDMNELEPFQSSKYIQSDFSAAFGALNNTGKALIFGTPCQVAAFDKVASARGERDKFILIDLICHGVPTRSLLVKYFSYIEKQYKIKRPHKIIFRDKSKGWRERYIYNGDLGKSVSLHQNKDLFFRFFENGHCYSKSCYECPFRTASSADIRIGDYWGPRFKKDKTGVSMVLVLSEKGYSAINALKKAAKGQLKEENVNDYSNYQQMVNFRRPIFYEDLIAELNDDSVSLDKIAHKYCGVFDKIRRINKILYPIYKKAKAIYKKRI